MQRLPPEPRVLRFPDHFSDRFFKTKDTTPNENKTKISSRTGADENANWVLVLIRRQTLDIEVAGGLRRLRAAPTKKQYARRQVMLGFNA
jgi:hypothetical protein